MLSHFTKIKLCWPHPLGVVAHPGFGRFQSFGLRFWRGFSCRTQIGQPFEVPTDTFELQFQPVGFASHIPHPPVTCAPLPPSKHFLNLAPNRTEQPVRPHSGWPQLLPTAGLAQNPVGHTVLPAPFAAGLTPI